MSLCAVWLTESDTAIPCLWIATDSRLSGPNGPLLDEGSKLLTLPIICRKPAEDGTFSVPSYVNAVGLACVGGSLVYNSVYAFVTPLLSTLIGAEETPPPSLEEIGVFLAEAVTIYVRSLGNHNPNAVDVGLVVTGFCPRDGKFEAHVLEPRLDAESLVRFSRDRSTCRTVAPISSALMSRVLNRRSPSVAEQRTPASRGSGRRSRSSSTSSRPRTTKRLAVNSNSGIRSGRRSFGWRHWAHLVSTDQASA